MTDCKQQHSALNPALQLKSPACRISNGTAAGYWENFNYPYWAQFTSKRLADLLVEMAPNLPDMVSDALLRSRYPHVIFRLFSWLTRNDI